MQLKITFNLAAFLQLVQRPQDAGLRCAKPYMEIANDNERLVVGETLKQRKYLAFYIVIIGGISRQRRHKFVSVAGIPYNLLHFRCKHSRHSTRRAQR